MCAVLREIALVFAVSAYVAISLLLLIVLLLLQLVTLSFSKVRWRFQ